MSGRAKPPLVIAASIVRKSEYWRTKRDRARRGLFVGMCDCGRLGRKFVGGCVACDHCIELERRIHGSELTRGVCGYVSRGVLARRANG
jgi:hypothetical protein